MRSIFSKLILCIFVLALFACSGAQKKNVGTKASAVGGSIESKLRVGMTTEEVENTLGPAPAGSISMAQCGEASGTPWPCRKEKRDNCELIYQEREAKPGYKQWMLNAWKCG